jgi:hypothetical protein
MSEGERGRVGEGEMRKERRQEGVLESGME